MTLGKLLPPPQPPGLGFPICAVVEVVLSDLSKSDHPPLNPRLRLPVPRVTTRGRSRPAFGPARAQGALGRLRQVVFLRNC